jgi:hypothetical protein
MFYGNLLGSHLVCWLVLCFAFSAALAHTTKQATNWDRYLISASWCSSTMYVCLFLLFVCLFIFLCFCLFVCLFVCEKSKRDVCLIVLLISLLVCLFVGESKWKSAMEKRNEIPRNTSIGCLWETNNRNVRNRKGCHEPEQRQTIKTQAHHPCGQLRCR